MLQSAPVHLAGDTEWPLTGQHPADTTSPDTAVRGHQLAVPAPAHHCPAPGPAPGPDSYRPDACRHSSPWRLPACPEYHRRIRDHSIFAGSVAGPGVTTGSPPQPAPAPAAALLPSYTVAHSKREKLHVT